MSTTKYVSYCPFGKLCKAKGARMKTYGTEVECKNGVWNHLCNSTSHRSLSEKDAEDWAGAGVYSIRFVMHHQPIGKKTGKGKKGKGVTASRNLIPAGVYRVLLQRTAIFSVGR